MNSDSDSDTGNDSEEERLNQEYEEMGHEKTTCIKCKKIFYPETYDNNEICRKCRGKFYINVTYKEKEKYHDGYCSDPEYHKISSKFIKKCPVPSNFTIDDFDDEGHVCKEKWNIFNMNRKSGCCYGYVKYKVKGAQLVGSKKNLFAKADDDDDY